MSMIPCSYKAFARGLENVCLKTLVTTCRNGASNEALNGESASLVEAAARLEAEDMAAEYKHKTNAFQLGLFLTVVM